MYGHCRNVPLITRNGKLSIRLFDVMWYGYCIGFGMLTSSCCAQCFGVSAPSTPLLAIFMWNTWTATININFLKYLSAINCNDDFVTASILQVASLLFYYCIASLQFRRVGKVLCEENKRRQMKRATVPSGGLTGSIPIRPASSKTYE